jgi:hypothetical protein
MVKCSLASGVTAVAAGFGDVAPIFGVAAVERADATAAEVPARGEVSREATGTRSRMLHPATDHRTLAVMTHHDQRVSLKRFTPSTGRRAGAPDGWCQAAERRAEGDGGDQPVSRR